MIIVNVYVLEGEAAEAMNPTIKDVAKKANVSIATVSRILNNQPGYSRETKEKVLQAIEELGYQPNAVARGLVNKRTQTIGVLFPDVSSMLSSEILNGIEDATHERGSSVIVCNTDSNGKRTMKYLQLLNEKRVDGIIFTSEVLTESYYNTLSDMNIPVVLVSTASYRHPLPYVKVDDRHAAYSATEYLIHMGHTRIAMISGPREDPIAGTPRIEGYRQALRDHGLSIREDRIVVTGGFGFREGMESFPRLAALLPEVTAVFAASDEMAIGVMSAAFKEGVRIPDQLSIIGYDNLKMAEMAIPPLTTVAQPLYRMGKTAADMLFEMLETRRIVESRIMPHQVIERQSVKRLT